MLSLALCDHRLIVFSLRHSHHLTYPLKCRCHFSFAINCCCSTYVKDKKNYMKFDAIIVIVVFCVLLESTCFSVLTAIQPLRELNYQIHELKNFSWLRKKRRNACRNNGQHIIAIATNECNASEFFCNIAMKL